MSCRQPGRCNAHGLERQIPGLAELWARTLGDSRVCIAVLDDRSTCPTRVFPGRTSEQVEGPASGGGGGQGAAVWHGTHLASLIFGQPGSPVRGLAPRCRGLAVPIYRERGDGSLVPCSQLDLAGDRDSDGPRGEHHQRQRRAARSDGPAGAAACAGLAAGAEQGVLVVAAAGNDGCACLHVPAAAQSVLVAGAMDAEGEPLEFSNWARPIRRTACWLPATTSAVRRRAGGSVVFSGTSVAAALVVSGLAGPAGQPASNSRRAGATRGRSERPCSAAPAGCDELPASNCQRLLAGRLNILENPVLAKRRTTDGHECTTLPRTWRRPRRRPHPRSPNARRRRNPAAWRPHPGRLRRPAAARTGPNSSTRWA